MDEMNGRKNLVGRHVARVYPAQFTAAAHHHREQGSQSEAS